MQARTQLVAVPGSRSRIEVRHAPSSEPRQRLAVVAPPHPVHGGTIGNPVIKLVERAFQKQGLATLAFNFRGTGESDGEPSEVYEDSITDYLAAARSQPDVELAFLAGYSFGSVAALGSAIELDAPRVLMVAPPLGLLDPTLVTRYRGKLAVIVGTDDEYAPIDAVRELFGTRADTTLELLEGVEHFFSGSGAYALAAGLDRLLARVG